MKKLLKSIPVYLTVAMILCCSFFVPASAFTYDDRIDPVEVYEDVWFNIGEFVPLESCTVYKYVLPAGYYSFVGDFELVLDEVGNSAPGIFWYDPSDECFYSDEFVDSPYFVWIVGEPVEYYISFMDTEPAVYSLTLGEPPVDGDEPPIDIDPEPVKPEKGFFYQAFDIFADYIYGEGAELTAEQNMVLTILATVAVLFVVIVPFLIVYFVIKMFG